ncbi:MAG TPA: DNA sulfur modification protein DndB [Flavobacterium sp.]|jgi:DNA sulfur modification protein DndB
MSSKKAVNKSISLPCLRGRMGDWYYYVTLLKFSEVASRVKLPKEIDSYYENKEDLKLGDWIQRDLEKGRTQKIVDYLRKQPQHFFNSLILGIYEGNPSWQDVSIKASEEYENLNESDLKYLSRTFGILNLEGSEDIFAIDGQHRAISIREAVTLDKKLAEEEIAVIFVAHKTTIEGKVRTRRLFSTLNKYAKPVSQSEIIALSEDNNCAIITRELVDNFLLFKDKVLTIKNRSINPDNTTHFTNVLVLYDIVERLVTNKAVVGMKVSGHNKNFFITDRVSDDVIKKETQKVKKIITEIVEAIPDLKTFFEGNEVNRKLKKTSLLFRPIGQNVFFDTLKVAIEKSKKKEALEYFSKNNFSLNNKIWKKIFWDEETDTMITDKSRQRFATILLLEHLGIGVKKTKKDLEIAENFKVKL